MWFAGFPTPIRPTTSATFPLSGEGARRAFLPLPRARREDVRGEVSFLAVSRIS